MKIPSISNFNEANIFNISFDFSDETVQAIPLCIPAKYQENVLHLHYILCSILRAISSQQCIDVDRLQTLCTEASLLIARSWPWAKINHTLHGVLHHAPELIQCNEGFGLGALSEEGLESTNKHVRRYLEVLARKTSSTDELSDVFSRLLERSNPVIANERQKLRKKKTKKCTLCGSEEHSSAQHANPPTRYESLFFELIVQLDFY